MAGVKIEELGEDGNKDEDDGQSRPDTILAFLTDPKVITIMSTLIAKMERPIFDDTRTTIFRTPWGRHFFSNVASSMMGEPFDIDAWYRAHVVVRRRSAHRDIDAAIYLQPIETDWLSALMELELAAAAKSRRRRPLQNVSLPFLNVLYSVLEIEDGAHNTLAELCKKERQYDLLGISKPNVTGGPKLLTSAASSAPKPGSLEDLLESSKKKK